MLNYNNGFTFVEVLISSSIILLLVAIFIPLTTLLKQEKTVLSHRRMASVQLHDELQKFIWTDSFVESSYSKTFQSKPLYFDFIAEEEFIKGCVTWENARNREETFCLYGISKK